MTQSSQDSNAVWSAQPRPADGAMPPDPQRQSLEQIVRLSIECTAEERHIEEQHEADLAQEKMQHQTTREAAVQRYKRRGSELAAQARQKEQEILTSYATRLREIEQASEQVQRQSTRLREEAESAIRKQAEQACWQAESALVTLEMKVDVDEQQSKKEEDASKAELASLGTLEELANDCVARWRVTPATAPCTAPDEALRQRLEADRAAVAAEYKHQAEVHLRNLQAITQVRLAEDLVPLFLVLIFAAAAGGVTWWLAPGQGQNKVLAAAGAAMGGLIIGSALFLMLRARARARTRAQAKAAYVPFAEALAKANEAARYDVDAAAEARERRVNEARRKRDQEAAVAREKARAGLAQALDEFRRTQETETRRFHETLVKLEQERDQGLADLVRIRAEHQSQREEENVQALHAEEARHAARLQEIEETYARRCRELTARWDQGLQAVQALVAAGGGIDPDLIDWNNPAWERWRAPTEFSGKVRFGQLKVDLTQLTEQLPKRLKLPEAFSVPALLSPPAQGSLLIETDHSGRAAAIDVAQMVMARLLTQMPAGRVKFTLFDPVGLGQSFAGFMHLADHDESLVGSRIWTEKEHIQQRLADLTEHMETVIQKYLRNEYATIDQYNAQAGELAEPIRYLVIADFPTGFEPETLRRLTSIALSGPRCGVYTIILRDTRQALPSGSRLEEICGRSVRLQYKAGTFTWEDPVFKRFPLQLDMPPDERTLTALMDRVGREAKDAKRVEVPFQSIAPADGGLWLESTSDCVRVPIGKTGATRLQALRLGVGVAQHALVAGKTGSGKSNLMHTIITNLALWHAPDEVEFYLIDFKKGVEFKPYVTHQLPHARAIAVESDREFGLSVLQRVDGELSRRGAMFRDVGVQEINAYRQRTGQKLPRTLLLIDEFQEFFSEDDKLGQEAAGLMDRLVRQGRAFGVHLILGSQTIGGTSGLARSTLGQIAVRIALQCTEADSQMILGDNNSAARLLSRPGEAVYNDAGGLVEANSPFQIAFLPDEQRERYLEKIQTLAQSRSVAPPTPIVFEGNTAAAIRKNPRLMGLLQRGDFPPAASAVPAYVGEPVAIKEPTAVPFRRQAGSSVLMVGQQEESAIAIFASMATSLAAQHKPGAAPFYLMDGTPADSRYYGMLERVLGALPQQSKIVPWRQVPEAIDELAQLLAQRQGKDEHTDPSVYLMIFGLQRYRLLRRQEDDFSFSSRGEEAAAPKPDKQFGELLSEGPALGVHTILWADTPITVERTLDRSAMRQFDYRILFQMSAADSSNLIDSPLANRLGAHRALLYSEEQGTFEKFRPYEVPDKVWIEYLSARLRDRAG